MRTFLNVITRGILGSVKGTNAGVDLPFDQVEAEPTLKEVLRHKHGTSYPVAPLVEVILPPVLDIKAMAAKREATHKDVPVATVHHRAVLKPDADKGVTVEVIGDEVMSPVSEPVTAETIIYTGAMEEDGVDLRFWDTFMARMEAKNPALHFATDEELLAAKAELGKGYHAIFDGTVKGFPDDVVGGIVHVTKNNISALYLIDRNTGTFRTVCGNNRFNGATEVGIQEAKAFLNGR